MTRRYTQPQTGSPIDWDNPVTRGIVCPENLAYTANATIVGTKNVPSARGVAKGFGATLGAGSTDSVQTKLTTSSTARSFLIIYQRAGSGGGGGGRIFDKRTVSGQVEEMQNGGAGMIYGGSWTGGSGLFTWASYPNGTPINCVLSYDKSSTANIPTVYENGIKQSVSVSSAPTGSVITNTDPYVVGNRKNDSARAWDGLIYCFIVWDRALSEEECKSLSDNPWQIFQPTNRQFFVSSAGGGGVTISCTVGNAVAAGPNASINQSVTISATPGAAVADGVSARINVGISAGVGNAVAAGTNARQNISVAASVGNTVAAGVSAAITTSGGTTISCSVGNAAASGVNAAVNVSIRTTTGNAVAAGTNAGLNVSIPAGVGNAVASGVQALLPISIRAIVGDAIASGVQATCQFSDPESTPPTSYYRRVAGSILAGRVTGVDNAIFLRIARRRGR